MVGPTLPLLISFPYRVGIYLFMTAMTFFPFDMDTRFSYPLNSPLSRVVVLSDTEYQKYQQKRARQEITLLESKKNRLNAAIADIEAEIQKIKEEHKLLPAPESTNEIKDLLS